MYAGFELSFDRKDLGKAYEDFYSIGLSIYKKQEQDLTAGLEKYKDPDGRLNAEKMQSRWFPITQADIFLSHSHVDKDLAIALAGMIKTACGLTVFIDSVSWGYANDLLKLLDNRYCYNKTTKTYNYNDRNITTSHIHMQLALSISRMIDETECLFLLNTPNSVPFQESVTSGKATLSPWIAFEVFQSKIIRKRNKFMHRNGMVVRAIMESVFIKNPIDTDHLTNLTATQLLEWCASDSGTRSTDRLDELYATIKLESN